MISITSKICVVGDFAVGKTSVTERFVNNHFSEQYHTTVGVKIDTRDIERPDLDVLHKLVIWDVAGSDRFDAAQLAYMRGASGYIYVADGTRVNTMRSLVYLQEQISELYDGLPSVALVNKSDLRGEWQANEEHLETLRDRFGNVFITSAKTGDEVERAIDSLAENVLQGLQQQT